ncbi:hypothetical protein JHK85_031984 [Glycine max]|nr:hypothetical protein JHK85_031984 [Glycine max]
MFAQNTRSMGFVSALSGAKIGATLWQELFVEFESKLHCVSKIPFLVYLVKTTSIKEAERPKIPPDVHVITRFTDIIVGVAPRDTLVDVFGYSDGEMIMTVWEEYALQLDDAIEKNHIDRKPLVIMLTLAKIKDPKDKYLLSVQNIKHGSKLYVNIDIAEIREIHNRLDVGMPFYAGELSDQGSSGDEVKVFPPCVDELLGKTWALRFKYRVQIRQSSVLDVTEDKDIIQTITSTIGLQLADYDLGLFAFVTPAKRMSDQQASSEFHSDEYTPY